MLERLPECSWSKLRKLDLHNANLAGQLPVWIGNLTNLSYLDISWNMLVGHVPFGMGNMRSLSYLDLSQNRLVGSLSSGIGNMRSLSYLDLSQNRLVGSLPSGIGNMRSLSYLDLSQNMLAGDVPRGLGALSNLTYFSLGLNNFSGVLSKDHFADLTEGHFGSCDMGPQFPAWLRWQTGIRILDISNTRINDVLPHWKFWVVVSIASSLDLSRNQHSGGLPANLELPFIEEMDLSRNSFTGKLRANIITSPLKNLLLYNNNFTGPIPEYLYDKIYVQVPSGDQQGCLSKETWRRRDMRFFFRLAQLFLNPFLLFLFLLPF
ncbi:hypothetical protein PVAP13_5NG298500 [Panicum virgatum]|uniref:Uncharacterized protein n=1 Tax=Panicum virgatum TaxID=38727 RepID=A0A8T0RZ98_PANVG|nr:hypothetical protein PVAP13_5NG298500 [Panicum virgatum]